MKPTSSFRRSAMRLLRACSVGPTFGAFATVLVACGNTPPLPAPPPPPLPVAAPSRIAEKAPAPGAARETPDAPFRDAMPTPDGKIDFVPPRIESFALKNGLRVLLVERHELPVVSVEVVVKGGAGDGADKPGAASFMGNMLEQGTHKRTALQISDEYEEIGAQHSAGVEWDEGTGEIKVLTRHLERALVLLADVLTDPTFPEAEIERLRARRLSRLQADKNSPGTMAQNALVASLYGRAHPYGNSLSGREVDAKALTRDELVRAYKRIFTPRNATIVVAGDVTRTSITPLLETSFGAWKGAGGPPPVPPKPAAAKGAKRLVIVDKPGAPQSQVFLAEPGISMKAPDRDAVSVMNAILGGTFSGRINMNLREAHAYTYGARSRFSMRRGAGPFSAGGAMFAEKTAPAVAELVKELEAIAKNDVTPDELSDAKEFLKQSLPGRFETVEAVTSALENIATYDLPLDEYATLAKRIDAVTAADVKKAAVAHLHPAAMRVIVVGDRQKLEGSLQDLKLGPADLRDAYGDPLSSP